MFTEELMVCSKFFEIVLFNCIHFLLRLRQPHFYYITIYQPNKLEINQIPTSTISQNESLAIRFPDEYWQKYLQYLNQSCSQVRGVGMFAKKKLKREDFLFQNGWFQNKLRRPGELQMQQFQISDCEQCNIFLFDAAACVYIDECKYCNIFIGACESSVFIRDCKYLNVVCTTQQFRVRDSFNCHFSIFCESQPIIESSYDITFSNFPQFAYQQLEHQMKEAKTTPWNNNWFDIYDFTPNKFNRLNFKLKNMEEKQWQTLLSKLRQKIRQINLKQIKSIIPRIIGRKQLLAEDLHILVVYPAISSNINSGIPILQSRLHRLNMQQQIGLHLNIPTKEARISVLFLKIQKKYLSKWKSVIPAQYISRQICNDLKQLQLYDNTVFAPFKDEH